MADEFQLFKRKADADECSIHSESDLQSTSSWEIVSENELWSDFETSADDDDSTDRNVSEKTIDKDDVDIVKETFNVSSVLRLITLSEQTSADDDSTDRNFSEETTNNDDLTDRNVCSDNDDFDIVKVTDNFAKSLSRDTTFCEQFIGDKDSTGSKMNPLPVMVIQLLLPLAFVMLCNVMSCFM
ncbi:hypothetical protein TNCT_626361 [Trichonephila clavata]|uniref:Uncharacterized protein n=1 Tax=Trichonephila clavata TaxID=2740835 RepID=A0A8X6II07_TRICU|nr:hypothetical protein TNCT_626361 [Trichonephila clavata]